VAITILRSARPRRTTKFVARPATLTPQSIFLAQRAIRVLGRPSVRKNRPRHTFAKLSPAIIHYSPVTPPGTPPSASFTWTNAGLVFTFTDTSIPGSSGPITSWAWDFGDGGTSTLQNPTHTYAGIGTYSVTLIVNGTGGDGTASTRIALTVATPGGAGLHIDAVIF
jgi:hypothetical protein